MIANCPIYSLLAVSLNRLLINACYPVSGDYGLFMSVTAEIYLRELGSRLAEGSTHYVLSLADTPELLNQRALPILVWFPV